MPALLRVALIGGSDMLRGARRVALEENSNLKVVLESDGFALSPTDLLAYSFDVAVLDQRLPSSAAFDYVKAMQSMAKVNSSDIGRILISATFQDVDLRIQAIESGAVDCVFVDQGIEAFVSAVKMCKEPEADYAIRELLPELKKGETDKEAYAKAATSIDSLDFKEQAILENFCLLKTDAQIAQTVQVPKLKVRQTITKVQNLLLLNTRSELLLKLCRLGALTF